MFNLGLYTLVFALASGVEALKIKLQKGVYFRNSRTARLFFFVAIPMIIAMESGDVFLLQLVVGIAGLLILFDWLIPYQRLSIHMINGSKDEALNELVNVLEEEGYHDGVMDTDQEGNPVIRIPSLKKTKMILKEKGILARDKAHDQSKLDVIVKGYGNPVKETLEAYMTRMRTHRRERSFHRTILMYGLISLILFLTAAVLLYVAWHSPMEVPNQRLDEVFD